jgi:hypothetical protein
MRNAGTYGNLTLRAAGEVFDALPATRNAKLFTPPPRFVTYWYSGRCGGFDRCRQPMRRSRPHAGGGGVSIVFRSGLHGAHIPRCVSVAAGSVRCGNPASRPKRPARQRPPSPQPPEKPA